MPLSKRNDPQVYKDLRPFGILCTISKLPYNMVLSGRGCGEEKETACPLLTHRETFVAYRMQKLGASKITRELLTIE